MADLHHVAIGASDGAVTDAEAAEINAGLREYMLRIYNYMGLGLAITGLASLATYSLSITDDPDHAAKIVRDSAQIPAYLAGKLYLTPIGYALFVGPSRWAIIFAPVGLAFGLSFGIDKLRPMTAQVLFWVYSTLD